MIPIFLDENAADRQIIAILRKAGHSVTTTQEEGLGGQSDLTQLQFATSRSAALATKNVGDFAKLHRLCEAEGRAHQGIILLHGRTPNHVLGTQIERAARLLAPNTARNRLLRAEQFADEDIAQATTISLLPPSD